ncbi:MAG: response regulator [Enhydrobacter sp.]
MDRFQPIDVLVVDDDPEIIHQIAECFEAEAISCSTVIDPISALQMVSGGLRPSVVLTDLRMPDLDGMHFAHRLQQLPAESKPVIVFMSGHANLEDAIQAIRLGAHDLLLKPVDRDKLVNVMRSALASHRSRVASISGTSTPKLPKPSDAAKSESTEAKRAALGALREVRKIRRKHLPEELFSDPCWEMLLDLYESHLTMADVTVTGLGVMSGVPLSTALRRIHELQNHGLIDRVDDSTDRRRTYVKLTDKGLDAVDSFFDSYLRSAC